jgi:hypothetical protein
MDQNDSSQVDELTIYGVDELLTPAASRPRRRYRHAVLVRAAELDLDAERVRQISGLVDSLRRGDQTQATVQRRGRRRDLALMLLKPRKAAPVLRTDPARSTQNPCPHALQQTTDRFEASVSSLGSALAVKTRRSEDTEPS